jgi:hypothetical protein
VVVDHEFHNSVIVKISVSNGIGWEDVHSIDVSLGDEGSINSWHTIEADSLVKELSSEDNNFVLVVLEALDNLDTDIGTRCNNMFGPGSIGQTLLGVLEPDELTTLQLGVGASSKEIFSSITVHVNPFTHMVEVTVLLGANLISTSSLGNISVVNCDDINATIVLTRDKETIRNDNCVLSENIMRYNFDVVGPFKLGGVKLYWLKGGNVASLDCLSDTRHNVDVTSWERITTERRAEEEFIWAFELGYGGEGSVWELEVTKGLPSNICGCGGGSSEKCSSEFHLCIVFYNYISLLYDSN